MDSKEEVFFKPGERSQNKVFFEGDSVVAQEVVIQEVELSPQKELDFMEESRQKIQVESSHSLPEVVAGPLVALDSSSTYRFWMSSFVSLEQHGGQGYYKLIEQGLTYSGNLIESAQPIFTQEDTGKSFCGLFAHRNPLEPDDDEFFPGIVGSRYSRIVEVIDAYSIRVNFEYNGQSDKGYVFFDNSLAFRSAVNSARLSPRKTLELQDDKTYVIPEYSKIGLDSDFFVFSRNGANLKIGLEDYFQWSDNKRKKQDDSLFDFGGKSVKIGFFNVNFLPPHRRVKAAQLFYTNLFASSPRKEQEAQIAVINMDTTKEVNGRDSRYNQLGFGYGFLYSSEPGNYVIGKNIRHRGPGFMDFKANFGGGLTAVFENIQTDFKDEESFASPRVKVKGRLENNLFTITSGHTIYQIFTYDFGVANVCHLLHLGRYTFVIDGKNSVINATQFRVRPYAEGRVRLKIRDAQSVYSKKVELHSGDRLIHKGTVYTVLEKNRTYVTEWLQGDADTAYAMCLKLDKMLPVSSGFLEFDVQSVGRSLNDGKEQDAYLIYKANYDFRTYVDTKFANGEVLSSDPVGHLSYNHKEITLWAKNFRHLGFYRQSLSRVGKSQGYTLINCEGFGGQFNPDLEVKKFGEMPDRAKLIIQEIENLGQD
jgi:hypothetical protein